MEEKEISKCIELQSVHFFYDGIAVLEDITLSIKSGDYAGIVGPNGGGKTTLLKIIVGLLKPTSGEVKIFGHSVEKAKEHYDIGYVPQQIGKKEQYFPATVEEVVRSGRTKRLSLLKKFHADDTKAVVLAMKFTDILNLKHKQFEKLSGGQKQRVYIARALTKEPKILVLDEPTEGIDFSTKETFYNILAQLNKELKLTILLVSHELDVVAKEVKSVVCLNKRLVCQTTSQKFLQGSYIQDMYGKDAKFVLHEH